MDKSLSMGPAKGLKPENTLYIVKEADLKRKSKVFIKHDLIDLERVMFLQEI